MKRVLAIGMMVCTLSSALCRAESVSLLHDFNTMVGAGTLTFPGAPGSYTVGTTDLVTYTGSNSGTFDYSGGYVFSLPSNGSTLVISPAVLGLTRVYITHTKGSSPTWIKVYISEDGTSWTDVSASTTYDSSTIDAVMPEAGDYYIKIVNNGTSKPVFLRSVRYTYDPTPCNCFRYIAP